MKFSTKTIIALSIISTSEVNGHGRLTKPDTIQIDAYGFKDHWYTQGSSIGCEEATGENCPLGGACCDAPMEPTLSDFSQLTYRSSVFLPQAQENMKNWNGYNNNNKRQLRGLAGNDNDNTQQQLSITNSPVKSNPWFAPGHAPIADVCGILGGWRYSNAKDYSAGPGNYEKYQKGEIGVTNAVMPPVNMSIPAGTPGTTVLLNDLDTKMMNAQGSNYSTNTNPVWKSGDVQEVSYTLIANHGGGIQYRICPLDNLLNNTISEDCFEALDFVGDTSWFQYTDENSELQSIPFTAVRVSDANTAGVLPKGSTWTQVGLPACADEEKVIGRTCDAPMFENELTDAGFWGYANPVEKFGGNSKELQKLLKNEGANFFDIVDQVKVPEGRTGDFVFQWRWDSEQSPQVWTQCAVITIEE